MPLPTQHAVQIGVLVGLGNMLIYNHFVGASLADIRSAEPYDGDIEKSERSALIASTVFTVVVAGFVQSWETFAIGGLAIVATDFAIKHANAVSPLTGKIATQTGFTPTEQSYPALPDYSDTSAGS